MQRRRELMAMQKRSIDTSPRILQYDKRYNSMNIIDQAGYCITDIYSYPPQTYTQYITANNVYFQIQIYKDGKYIDYWSGGNYKLNVNSNGIAVTLYTAKIDDSYLYINGTGQILFAGKNTPYYGYTNINDMPSA